MSEQQRSNIHNRDETRHKTLRRVVIEERQAHTLDHNRQSLGYAQDLDPHAHDKATFKLINQRRELEKLPDSDYIVPRLDEWRHWERMNDWDSRTQMLEDLTGKLRRREASSGEVMFLITVCRPAWASIGASLRRYGGLDCDPGAEGLNQREEARRVNELDRAELDQVIQNALLEALTNCPRPFPRYFFPWLKKTLAFRAIEFVRDDITEHGAQLPYDFEITEVVDGVLNERSSANARMFAAVGARDHDQWLRTLDLPAIFEVADEYATYARGRTACERAVRRLPNQQGRVIQKHYYEQMTQTAIAREEGLSPSTVRNSKSAGLRNLNRDDELFDVLEAIGKVRDQSRREQLEKQRRAAA